MEIPRTDSGCVRSSQALACTRPPEEGLRVNTISMMKSKKDPDMKEQLFETVCTVPRAQVTACG